MIKKCLFPAAGYGTRFLPATKAMPKEMLPVVNKPLIQYGVEEALDAGLNEISIVTGRGKRALEDHFDISYELENQIKGTDKEKYLVGIRQPAGRVLVLLHPPDGNERPGPRHPDRSPADRRRTVRRGARRTTCASTWKVTAYSPRWSSCTSSIAAPSSQSWKSTRKKPANTA